jgi:hypothetical protein
MRPHCAAATNALRRHADQVAARGAARVALRALRAAGGGCTVVHAGPAARRGSGGGGAQAPATHAARARAGALAPRCATLLLVRTRAAAHTPCGAADACTRGLNGAQVWAAAWRAYRDSLARAFGGDPGAQAADADADAEATGEGAALKRELGARTHAHARACARHAQRLCVRRRAPECVACSRCAQLPPPGRARSARGRRCASCTRRARARTETACASLCWATARRSGTRCCRRVRLRAWCTLSSAARAVALTAFSSSCVQEAARMQQEAARRRDTDATAGQARPLDVAPAAGGAAAPGTATSQASTAGGVPPSPKGG